MFTKERDLVDFERFLTALNSSIAMNSTLSYIFSEIQSLGQPNPRATEVLLNALKIKSSTKTLNFDELADAMKRILCIVSEDELGLLMLDYDTTGAGRAFELSLFESDFAEWQTKDFKDKMYGNR